MKYFTDRDTGIKTYMCIADGVVVKIETSLNIVLNSRNQKSQRIKVNLKSIKSLSLSSGLRQATPEPRSRYNPRHVPCCGFTGTRVGLPLVQFSCCIDYINEMRKVVNLELLVCGFCHLQTKPG